MSVKIMSMVFEATGLTPNQKLVMLALADHGNEDGLSIYPAIPTTAKRTGLSAGEVRRTQKELSDKKLLTIEIGGGRSTNNYTINITNLLKLTPSHQIGVPAPPATPPLAISQGSPSHQLAESLINRDSTVIKTLPKKNGTKPKPEPTPQEVLTPIVNTIAEVTAQNVTSNNIPRLKHVAKTLYSSNYTADIIRSVYGPGGAYWRDDWRGKKGQRPNLAIIQETIDTLAPKAKPKGNPNNPNGLSDDAYYAVLADWKANDPEKYQKQIEYEKRRGRVIA